MLDLSRARAEHVSPCGYRKVGSYGVGEGKTGGVNRLRRWLELLLFGTPSLLALATGPILARGLGADGRGQFALALAVYAFANSLGNFGQAERLAADLRDQLTLPRDGPRYFISASASLIAAVCAFIALRTINVDTYTSLAVALAVPVASMGFMWRALALSRGRTLLVAAQPAVPAILRLAALAALFFSGRLTVFGATALTMLATSIGFLTIFWRLKVSRVPDALIAIPKTPRRLNFLADLKTGLVQGLPVVGFNLNSFVIFRADIFMLNAISTRDQLGLYAAAVALTEASWAASTAFKNRMQAAAYTARPLEKIRWELTLMLLLSLPIVLVCELFTRQLTVAMLGESFAGAVPVMRILLVTAIALMIFDCGQGLLAVFGLRRAMFSTTAVGAVITVVALWLLIPRFGAVGAAVASLCAYSAVGVASWTIAFRVGPRD